MTEMANYDADDTQWDIWEAREFGSSIKSEFLGPWELGVYDSGNSQ